MGVIEDMVRAFTFDQFEAFLRTSRPKYGQAHGTRDLNTRNTDTAAGAVDQHGFAATGLPLRCNAWYAVPYGTQTPAPWA